MDQHAGDKLREAASIISLTNRWFNTWLMRGDVIKKVTLANEDAK